MSSPRVIPDGTPPALEAQHLTVRLEDVVVLDDVSIAVPPGHCLALIGHNGSGKTTFLRAVLGLIPPTEGVIRILGQRPERARHLVGYLPQHKGFDRAFPATSVELLVAGLRGAWPARIRAAERQRCVESLDRFGAADLADRRVADLSGGELQRVFLARALVREPRLLLLDEPSTGLDPEARQEVDGILCELAREADMAMIVVTHDLRGLQTYATTVVYLDRRVVTQGDTETILAEAPDHLFFGHVHHEDEHPR